MPRGEKIKTREELILRKKLTLRFVIAALLIFLIAALAVAIATDSIVTSRVSGTVGFLELRGIQGADTTQNVAQQKKAKERGKTAEAKELDEIRGGKVRHFQVISAAQNAQSKYYEANEKGNDAAALRADLEAKIPEARSALGELKILTDREIELLKAIGGDESAIAVSKSFYKAMETAVATLQLDELSDEQVMARERDIQLAGKSAIHTARVMSDNFSPDDMDEGDKRTLEEEVVKPGEENAKSLGSVMSQMPAIIFGSAQGMLEGLNMFNKVMNAYDKDSNRIAHDLVYNQGMFSRRNMSAFQSRIDSIGFGVQQFLGEYSPFVDSVGRSVGREGRVDPLGYGANIIIRFQDSEGRYYIVHEEEDMGMRLVVDKNMTKWNANEDELRGMMIFDYNDASVEKAVAAIARIAPGFDKYVRASRMVYIRKAYIMPYRKSYVLQMSFQNADGVEMYFYEAQDPYSQPIDILRRNALEYRVLETMAVINPPKDRTVVRSYFGDRNPALRDSNSGARPDAAPPAAPPGVNAKPPRTKVSARGSIKPPEEGAEVLEALSADDSTKKYMIEQHEKAVASFNDGNYALALRVFSRVCDMAEGNYLDAYWAALSAHSLKRADETKKWLEKCLEAKADYMPALEMKKALKIK
jgi:hypothetical protein